MRGSPYHNKCYEHGYTDGMNGMPLQRDAYKGLDQLSYRSGWTHGYAEALQREIDEYNAAHGTSFTVRTIWSAQRYDSTGNS